MLREVASQTLMIKAHKQQLFSMFYLRRSFCSAKDFYFLVVLLSTIFILVSCKHCSPNEVQGQLEIDACEQYRLNSDVFDSHVNSRLVSIHSIQLQSLEDICPNLNSFCFPSTLSGFLLEEVGAKSEASVASRVQFEGFSSGLTQEQNNLSWSPPEHGIFRLSNGRVISCTLHQPDDFHEFSSSDVKTKNGQQNDVSSCTSTLSDYETHSSRSEDSAETVESGFLDGFSTPPVEIKPFLLDWGPKNIYHPSLAFLSVKNVDIDNVLSIYIPYSSNSQFYPCNISEIILVPGEVASICFVFFPTKLGLSSAQLVLQTSLGGFLIQAKGFGIESPYMIKTLSYHDVSPSGGWKKNLSLSNPFHAALHVEEVTAWISVSSGNTSRSSKAICRIHTVEDSSEYSALSTKEWLDVQSAEGGLPQIAVRPHNNWEVDPEKTETILELDISEHFEGKAVGALCLQLVRSSEDNIEIVMVPLEAESSPHSASEMSHVSVSLEALVPSDASGSPAVALSVRNDALHVLSVIKVDKVGEITGGFQVKSLEGLVLFPRSVTQVAILHCAAHLETLEANLHCKLLIQINDTRSSEIEIPCLDVISICSGHELGSAVGYGQEINSVSNVNDRERSFSRSIQPPSEIKVVDTREADELVLKSWKSQATASFMSVLDDEEVLFPMVHVGNHSSQWISVRNPSQEPIVAQLILNSGEVIHKCRTPDMHLQPSSSSILVGNKSIAPTRYGFSIAKDALTEVFIHPYGSASFGPILFQPSNRCEWTSSALIRNNLSGVEWVSLRGFGGSLSLVMVEGSDPVQSLEFKLNFPSLLNISSPEILNSLEAGKSWSCSHPLIKEVYAKNIGDFPLEVTRIEVSGSECALDGFFVRNCKGFSLPPGESVMLQVSYQSDFSAATIQRDLELTLATGILVIPMKASLPIYLLNLCKRTLFWIRLKKAMIVILLPASLLFLLICLLYPRVADIESGKNSGNSLSMRLNGKDSGPTPPKMNGFVRSNYIPLDNSNMQEASDSQNLRVRIGKEKRSRRKKKKSSGMGGVAGLFEVSSSQSGNSTPSSPLSPVASITPKRPWPVSPDTEVRRPFGQTSDKRECHTSSSKVNDVSSGHVNSNLCFSAQEESPSESKKLAGRAVLLPSATFPSAGRAAPSWTTHSPFLASTSTIAPHARAPGTKLHSPKTGELRETMGIEEKFTYDIWGDHLFGPILTHHQSEETPAMSPAAIQNNSESFFVRDPRTLMSSSLLKPVSSDLEEVVLRSTLAWLAVLLVVSSLIAYIWLLASRDRKLKYDETNVVCW